MNFEIYEPAEKKIFPTKLKLFEGTDGGVCLKAVNGDGTPLPDGNILTRRGDGTVMRNRCVDKTLGLDLDSNGVLIVTD